MVLYKIFTILLSICMGSLAYIVYNFYMHELYCETAFFLIGGVQFLFFLSIGIMILAGRAMFLEEWRRM